MIVSIENLYHAQELQKRAYNKGVKPRSHAPSDKVWLNIKHIKTKQNRKLEAKFFKPFRVLHPVGRQAYKLELPRKSFSTCHCWSRTPPGRGGWMRTTRRNWTPVTMIAVSMRWRQFVTARSMRESQNQVIYQVSTIWFLGKVIQKKKIPGSLHRPFSTLGSSSARSTKIIRTSRQRPLRPSTLHHRWPGQPSSQQPSQRLRNKSEANHQAIALTNELKKTELRLIFIVFLTFSRGVDNLRIKALSLNVT